MCVCVCVYLNAMHLFTFTIGALWSKTDIKCHIIIISFVLFITNIYINI